MRHKIRQWFAGLLTIVMLFSALPLTARAVQWGEIGGFTYTWDGTTLTLTGEGKLDLENKSLPWDKGLFNTVIIDGATSIADSCFKDWTNLQSVTLPNGLTSIGALAFAGC